MDLTICVENKHLRENTKLSLPFSCLPLSFLLLSAEGGKSKINQPADPEFFSRKTDLLRASPRVRGVQPGHAHDARPRAAGRLRAVRPHAARALQRDGGERRHPQGRLRQGQLLRGHAHPHDAGSGCAYGVLGVPGLGLGPGAFGSLVPGNGVGGASGCGGVPRSWVFDVQ